MERPQYLSKYLFDWELLDVAIGGRSALDSKFFLGPFIQREQVVNFLKGYGLDQSNPIYKAELFGIFQESLQFIRRYFLKEGNSEGLDIKIPPALQVITDVSDLFLMTVRSKEYSHEEALWAEIVLKIMHTILHVDKDLRSNYFSVIQTQIFDRFYKHIHRDKDDNLYVSNGDDKIQLIDFQTKAKKTRDSVIIKLLHKSENVAEELFDRVGVRFVTKNIFDSLRVIKFLIESNIVIPHNIKPSRSVNTLINVEEFRKHHKRYVRDAFREGLSEEAFVQGLEKELNANMPENIKDRRNVHTARKYRSIQFTGRQLIIYKNPFLQEFNEVKKLAKGQESSALAEKILSLDVSPVARDIRFFYPFEVQIIDQKNFAINSEGESSHGEYKKTKTKAAMKRVFWALLKDLNIEID